MIHGLSLGMCVLTLSYLLVHRGRSHTTRYASGMLVVLIWLTISPVLFEYSLTVQQIIIASLPLCFFIIWPLLYAYQSAFVAVRNDCSLFTTRSHMVPTILACLLGLSLLAMPKDDFYQMFFIHDGVTSFWANANAIGFMLLLLLWFFISLLYLFYMFKQAREYHQSLNTMLADHANKKLYWMLCFAVAILFLWLYACLVLMFEDQLSALFISEQGAFVILMCVIWMFCLNVLHRKPAFSQIEGNDNSLYERSSLPPERLSRIAEKISVLVDEENIYLDPDINAVFLARRLGISTHYLSQVFSQHLDTHFYDYINSARIDAAKVMLRDSDKTVLTIAEQVGFNTRSAFYNAFKKHTGLTPSAFRNAQN